MIAQVIKEDEGKEGGDGGREKENKKGRNQQINIRIYLEERSMDTHKNLSTRIFMTLFIIVENWKIKQGVIMQKHENLFYGK